MVLKIKENSIDIAGLKRTLTEEFQDQYQISNRSNFGVVLAKTKIVGVTVILRKNKLHIAGNFPKTWINLLYTVSMLLFAILIPLALYYIFLHKKMKAEEKKVTAYIKEVYADKILE